MTSSRVFGVGLASAGFARGVQVLREKQLAAKGTPEPEFKGSTGRDDQLQEEPHDALAETEEL